MKKIVHIFFVGLAVGVVLGSTYALWEMLFQGTQAEHAVLASTEFPIIVRDAVVRDLISVSNTNNLTDIESDLAATDLRDIIIPLSSEPE